MNPALRKLMDTTLAEYEADPRITGAWMYGSVGGDTEDEHSDVDPVFLVRDKDFGSVDAALRPMFERLCDRIVFWWPEGLNSVVDGCKNYAILFEADGDLLQYDMTIMSESFLASPGARGFLTGVTPEQIYFDRDGLIRAAIDGLKPDQVSPEHLVWMIGRFWVYAYIHIKYLLREDAFKLRFAQQMLFESHLVALQALKPHPSWSWWPIGAKRACSPEARKALLDYFGPGDQAAFLREMDTFSRDARAACEALGAEYPAAVEESVRRCVARRLGMGPV